MSLCILSAGIGYVKILASGLLSIYYPLLIGLSLFYLVWCSKGPIPFTECSTSDTCVSYTRACKTGFMTFNTFHLSFVAYCLIVMHLLSCPCPSTESQNPVRYCIVLYCIYYAYIRSIQGWILNLSQII